MHKIIDIIFNHDRTTKEGWVIGLAIRCPIVDVNSPQCQLYEVRKLKNLHDKILRIKSMTEEELNAVLTKHTQCIHND